MISAVDADDIYKIPLLLREQGLDDIIVDKLRLAGAARGSVRMASRGERQDEPGSAGQRRDGRQVCADPRFIHLAQLKR